MSKADVIEKLAWDPLFIASKEALKMIREDYIIEDQAKSELKAFNKKLKLGEKPVLDSVHKYKLNLINEAHSFMSEGIFSVQDINYFQTYYSRQDVTIFGTPRELNADTEMAWAVLNPLIDRYEKWKKIKELYNAQVIDDNEMRQTQQLVVAGQPFGEELGKSILFLERMHYARHNGIIDKDGYQKAVKLIPLMKTELLGKAPHAAEMNAEEILEGMERGDKVAFEEQVGLEEDTELNEYTQNVDPVLEWKRLVLILVDAWQAMIKCRIKEEFSTIVESNDIMLLQETHKFLVGLNKEYMASDQLTDVKNKAYLGKIMEFVKEKSERRANLLT